MTIEQMDYLYQGLLGLKWLLEAGDLCQAQKSLKKLLDTFDDQAMNEFYQDGPPNIETGLHQHTHTQLF